MKVETRIPKVPFGVILVVDGLRGCEYSLGS